MNVASVREFSGMGLYLGIASALLVVGALLRTKREITGDVLLLSALLLACGLPLILPQMNARSLYLAGMLAFCCGDGFTNVFFPTNALLLIVLGMTNVPYLKWFKWTWKLQLSVLALTALLLLLAVQVGYA